MGKLNQADGHRMAQLVLAADGERPTAEQWVSEPFLTVAAQPAYEIGRRAATLLLDQISGAHDATSGATTATA